MTWSEPGLAYFGIVLTLKQWGALFSKFRNDSLLEAGVVIGTYEPAGEIVTGSFV